MPKTWKSRPNRQPLIPALRLFLGSQLRPPLPSSITNPLSCSRAHRPFWFRRDSLGFLHCRPPLLLCRCNLSSCCLAHGAALGRGSGSICGVAKPGLKLSDSPVDVGEVVLVASESGLKEVVVGRGHKTVLYNVGEEPFGKQSLTLLLRSHCRTWLDNTPR
jgi:hypothetical protein